MVKTNIVFDKQPQKLAERAYAQLSNMILERELPSGTFVVEERIAEHLKISRTPIREAILRLAGEGLLVKSGGRSYEVRRVTAVEFFQSHKLREFLEPEAVEMAYGNVEKEVLDDLREEIIRLSEVKVQAAPHWALDDKLHLLFADRSGNAVLAKVIREIRVTTRLFEITNPLRRVQKDGEEHLAILDAFSSGNVAGARKAMTRHLRNLVSDTMQVLRGL